VGYLSDEVRQVVRDRAQGKCEYCLLSETDTPRLHPIDHIIPRQHRGKDNPDNLALCCSWCNRYKGPNLASLDPETDKLTALFNPRSQRWSEHFQLSSVTGIIQPLTPEGRVTAFVLKMNESERIQERLTLIQHGRYP
jgi:5-methylcytosine-specific restriction endonuclease McrA